MVQIMSFSLPMVSCRLCGAPAPLLADSVAGSVAPSSREGVPGGSVAPSAPECVPAGSVAMADMNDREHLFHNMRSHRCMCVDTMRRRAAMDKEVEAYRETSTAISAQQAHLRVTEAHYADWLTNEKKTDDVYDKYLQAGFAAAEVDYQKWLQRSLPY